MVFVNDGSRDNTWEVISQRCNKNQNIKGFNFSRNFGKEAAIFAGLTYATGDCCAVIDADLQHPPETLIKMYEKWQDGYEIVEGVKASRGKESFLHKVAAKNFYSLISKATNIDMSRASDFKLLDRKAVNILRSMPEKHIFFRALSSWVGFKTTSVEFHVQEREVGESKWSTYSLFKYAITNITSFSTAPMQIVTLTGVIFLVFSLILGIQSLYKQFMGHALEGFTTVILLLLIIGSILMLSLGIIGYYISKIYEETQNRPRFIVSEAANYEEKLNRKENVRSA
ncbi:glycosyltransferase family 2 protein [Romboutsia timonensis]|uniref:glycosyltransferase family 2 protein n=1 Tax=Romboutsia timonensis TaxID=1776391 RepID=UPI002E8DFCD0|nr:glycosyltransferase family 2 protein [Romboutsia timonensis]